MPLIKRITKGSYDNPAFALTGAEFDGNYDHFTAEDTAAKARANHTGTQAISTVSGLQTALDLKAPLASPTLTNPTFTGTVNSPIPPLVQTALDGKEPILSDANFLLRLADAADITVDGTYVPIITRTGGVLSGNHEPIVTPASATTYDILAGTASGLVDAAIARERWESGRQTLTITSGAVYYDWPAPGDSTTLNRVSNNKILVTGAAVTLGIGALTGTKNAAILAADKRHVLTFEFSNTTPGTVDCALTFLGNAGANMPLEWASGFSNPTIVAGTILTLTVVVTGNRGVVSQAVTTKLARNLFASAVNFATSVSLGNNSNLELIPGDLVVVFARSSSTVIPTVPAGKGYTSPPALQVLGGSLGLTVSYKFLEAADITAGVFASGTFTGSGRTFIAAVRNAVAVGSVAATATAATTARPFSPLTVIDPAMVIGLSATTATTAPLPAGVTELQAPVTAARLWVTTSLVSSWAPADAATSTNNSWLEAAVEIR